MSGGGAVVCSTICQFILLLISSRLPRLTPFGCYFVGDPGSYPGIKFLPMASPYVSLTFGDPVWTKRKFPGLPDEICKRHNTVDDFGVHSLFCCLRTPGAKTHGHSG